MRGLTLIETIITMLVMSIVLGVVGIAAAAMTPHGAAAPDALLYRARQQAAVEGVPVSVDVHGVTVAYAPDGSATARFFEADSVRVSIDPLTGEALHARP